MSYCSIRTRIYTFGSIISFGFTKTRMYEIGRHVFVQRFVKKIAHLSHVGDTHHISRTRTVYILLRDPDILYTAVYVYAAFREKDRPLVTCTMFSQIRSVVHTQADPNLPPGPPHLSSTSTPLSPQVLLVVVLASGYASVV